jgi:hypothetical protein
VLAVGHDLNHQSFAKVSRANSAALEMSGTSRKPGRE